MLNYVQRIQSGRSIFIFILFIFLTQTPFPKQKCKYFYVHAFVLSGSSTPVHLFEIHANVTDLVRLAWHPLFRAQPSSCAIQGGTPWP